MKLRLKLTFSSWDERNNVITRRERLSIIDIPYTADRARASPSFSLTDQIKHHEHFSLVTAGRISFPPRRLRKRGIRWCLTIQDIVLQIVWAVQGLRMLWLPASRWYFTRAFVGKSQIYVYSTWRHIDARLARSNIAFLARTILVKGAAWLASVESSRQGSTLFTLWLWECNPGGHLGRDEVFCDSNLRPEHFANVGFPASSRLNRRHTMSNAV